MENLGYVERHDLNYPKIWDTKWIKGIINEHDVEMIECDMCAFGKGPSDGRSNELYNTPTILLIPRCEDARRLLNKKPKKGEDGHQHVRAIGVSTTGYDSLKEAG